MALDTLKCAAGTVRLTTIWMSSLRSRSATLCAATPYSLARACAGRHVEIGDGADLDEVEQRREREIGGGDVAAADDADAKRFRHDPVLRAC